MDFSQLEYIIAIAKHRGIGKAAEEVHISQPALSKFVQNLENDLGQPLFRKLGNKFLLTYAGERYVETAKSLLETKSNLDKELADIIKNTIGELKIAFRQYGEFSVLSQAILVFRRRYPRIKISVYEGHSSIVEQMVLNGEVDLAFTTVQSQDPDLTYEMLNREELVLIMAPDHPRAREGVARPGCKYPWMDLSRLGQEQFILQWPDQWTRQEIDKVFRDAGIKPVNVLTMRNIYASIQLAVDGYGLAFAGETPLRFTRMQVSPLCFSVGNPCPTFDFSAIYRSGIYLPVYQKYFIAIVKDLVNKDVPFTGTM